MCASIAFGIQYYLDCSEYTAQLSFTESLSLCSAIDPTVAVRNGRIFISLVSR